MIIGVGMTVLVYNLATPAKISIENDRKTAAALAQAKEALIGYAASALNRPGALPCPDTDNDGSANGPAVGTGECTSYLGRLPWRTLDLPDLRDGSGERLWYALSPVFRNWPSSPLPGVLNSDTPGVLAITGITEPAIAIIFSPGGVVDSQVRDGTANENNVQNYLECGNGDGDDTYVTSAAGCNFNDKLLPITSDALFNVVNIRVAKVAINALESYRGTNAYYPFANLYGSSAPYDCTSALIRGRFPIRPVGCGQAAWGAELPGWFSINNWNLVTHYALSKSCGELTGLLAPLGPLLCGIATAIPGLAPLLALLGFTDDPIFVTGVTGADGARALVIVTGRALPGQSHTPACASADQCLEDTANSDGDETYVKPSRFPTSNDRMAICDSTACPRLP